MLSTKHALSGGCALSKIYTSPVLFPTVIIRIEILLEALEILILVFHQVPLLLFELIDSKL
jgi:hypothetical protein